MASRVPGTSGRFADVYNPATGEVWGGGGRRGCPPLATKAELDDAVARAAQAQIAWGATNPPKNARA